MGVHIYSNTMSDLSGEMVLHMDNDYEEITALQELKGSVWSPEEAFSHRSGNALSGHAALQVSVATSAIRVTFVAVEQTPFYGEFFFT